MKRIVIAVSLLLVTGMFAFANNDQIILQLIRQCEQNLEVTIQVNGTRRTERRQAELMANMTPRQLDMYGSSVWYVIEMKNSNLTGSARVDEFERFIRRARSQGSFVSRHLSGDAVDIAPSTPEVRRWLESNGISVKDETELGIRAWHLELR
jgi:hypothetical protein